MTEQVSPQHAGTVRLLCIDVAMGEAFLRDVTDNVSNGAAEVNVDGKSLLLEVLAGDPRQVDDWDAEVTAADAMILLARFLDVISLDKIKAIYRRLPSDKSSPFAVCIYREEDEADFKMSCPACGQKLWVLDSDVGKRGRCPNCKKAFKLPSQNILVRSQLMLPDTVRVETVVKGNRAQGRKVVFSLLSEMTGDLIATADALDQDTLKKRTVRVQIQP